MRDIDLGEISKVVKELSIEACTVANCDLRSAIADSLEKEESPVGKAVLSQLLKIRISQRPRRSRYVRIRGLPLFSWR